METAQAGLMSQILQMVLQILPYLFLLLLHHFLLAPLFFRKRILLYLPITLLLLTAFGLYCFNAGNPRDFRGGPPGQFQGPPPMMQQGPPPEGFSPRMDGMRPQMRPDDGHRPMRPEAMKLLIALLLVGVDLGVMAYIRNLKTEKKVHDLEAENQKHQDRLEELSRNAENALKANNELVFKTDYKQVRIKPDNILYIEGMGEYLKIYHQDASTPLVVLMSMKRILEQLPDDRFARVHKSYIINLKRISSNSRTQVTMENSTVIPIGESYRIAFSRILSELK